MKPSSNDLTDVGFDTTTPPSLATRSNFLSSKVVTSSDLEQVNVYVLFGMAKLKVFRRTSRLMARRDAGITCITRSVPLPKCMASNGAMTVVFPWPMIICLTFPVIPRAKSFSVVAASCSARHCLKDSTSSYCRGRSTMFRAYSNTRYDGLYVPPFLVSTYQRGLRRVATTSLVFCPNSPSIFRWRAGTVSVFVSSALCIMPRRLRSCSITRRK